MGALIVEFALRRTEGMPCAAAWDPESLDLGRWWGAYLIGFILYTTKMPEIELALMGTSRGIPIFAALAVVGMVRDVGARRFLLPAWVLVIALLDSRSFGTVSSVPMALLAAIAVREVLAPLVTSTRVRVALAGLAATYALVTVPQAAPERLAPVPAADRAAMRWVRDHTPSDARFVVVSERGWAENAPGEWFPALAERPSESTVQGYEWLPDRAFWTQMRRFFAAQSCGSRDAACLDDLHTRWGYRFDYVFLSSERLRARQDSTDEPCCGALRESMLHDERYELVYASGGVFVFHARR
jgi:hypothetical protein